MNKDVLAAVGVTAEMTAPAGTRPAYLKAAADQAIAGLRRRRPEAVKALIVATDFFEAQLDEAPEEGVDRLRPRAAPRAARTQG